MAKRGNPKAKGRLGPGAPGRKKGTPNKVTGQARAMFQAFVDGAAPRVPELWDQVADGFEVKHGGKTFRINPDPAQALNILGRLSEYVIPRLNRTEVTGADGERLIPPSIGITFGAGGPGFGGGVDDAPTETEGSDSPEATPGSGAAESET